MSNDVPLKAKVSLMLKIGLFGVGHLGRIHCRLLLELKDRFELVGFYDPDDANAQRVLDEFSVRRFDVAQDLLDAVDCVDIVTPTIYHFNLAAIAIKQSKHVFIEKPLAETLEEGRELAKLAHEAGVKVQVGHVERFNPAFQAAMPFLNSPMFIETHRLAQFNPRGTDVPVVLDLMIHDLDVILSVVNSGVRKISASGVSVVSDTPDIANARIEFDNGCVANLTSSRISLKNMRKSRFFQKDAYVSVDFLTKELEVVRIQDIEGEPSPFDIILELGEGKKSKKIILDKSDILTGNAIKDELIDFYQAISENRQPLVSVDAGLNALEVALEIVEKVKRSSFLA